MKLKTLAAALIVTTLITLSAWLLLGSPAARKAPEAIFTTITGKKIALTQLRGKPVIVTFWATDCPGCIEEIPHLIELFNDYSNKGLNIIAVAMFYDPPSRVVAMTKDKALPYPVALDVDAKHAQAFGDVRLTPTNFLIAPDGTIAVQKVGLMDMADIRSRIDQMLGSG
ncbi:MAG: TlpA disulfide reductase family protein [Pseudomonadota bacterium]